VATILLAGVDVFFRGKLDALLGSGHKIITTENVDPPDLVIVDIARVDPEEVAETFPDIPPRPSTITPQEVDLFATVAQLHAFSASIVADQTGGGILVLDRASQAERAQEQLRSTLKA